MATTGSVTPLVWNALLIAFLRARGEKAAVVEYSWSWIRITLFYLALVLVLGTDLAFG